MLLLPNSPASLAGPIDLGDPLADDPLNAGRVARWLAVPGLMGGATWPNLADPANPCFLNNFADTTCGWRAATRPGGWGQVLHSSTSSGCIPYKLAALTRFSIAAWVAPTAATGYQTIYADGSQGLWLHAGKIDYFSRGDHDGNTALAGDGSWHRVLVTYDGTTLGLYLDGRPDGQFAGPIIYPTTDAYPSITSTTLGIGSHGGGERFLGAIDDVSVWNRALSAAEARADYDDSLAGNPRTLRRLTSRTLSVAFGAATYSAAIGLGSASALATAATLALPGSLALPSAPGLATAGALAIAPALPLPGSAALATGAALAALGVVTLPGSASLAASSSLAILAGLGLGASSAFLATQGAPAIPPTALTAAITLAAPAIDPSYTMVTDA